MKTVIEMAREAGLLEPDDTEEEIRECGLEVWLSGELGMKALERFAEIVRTDEREACIEACWALELNDWEGRAACIAAIRARGNT